MDWTGDLSPFDVLILIVLSIAMARGLWIGLIRESLSLAALGAAAITARYGTIFVGNWLNTTTGGEIGERASMWIAGFTIVVLTVAAIGTAAKLLRRGARLVGLGWADRLGGGALGAAEGALVAVVLVLGVTWLVGKSHPVVEGSRSIAAVERLQTLIGESKDDLPSVSAPGDWR